MRAAPRQVACPPGAEGDARRFYADALGMTEVEKPPVWPARAVRGSGVRRARATAAEIHVGVEDPFAPARKAHPALVLDGAAELDELDERLAAAGFGSTGPAAQLPGLRAAASHGNRVEVLVPAEYS